MRKILLALLLVLASAVPAAPQATIVPATQFTTAVAGTVGTTLVVAGAAGQSIYVTALLLAPVATATVQFIQGTGATCGTGTSSLSAVMTFAAAAFVSYGDGSGAVFALLPGNSLCAIIGTAAAPGSLSYARF